MLTKITRKRTNDSCVRERARKRENYATTNKPVGEKNSIKKRFVLSY